MTILAARHIAGKSTRIPRAYGASSSGFFVGVDFGIKKPTEAGLCQLIFLMGSFSHRVARRSKS